MSQLAALREQQRQEFSTSASSLDAYFVNAQSQWTGCWIAAVQTENASCRRAIHDPAHSFLYLNADADGNLTGVWWDGEKRLTIDGKLNDSRRFAEGLALRNGRKLVSPLSFRAGHQFNSIEARFDWKIESVIAHPDVLKLSRLTKPRIVAISAADFDACQITSGVRNALPEFVAPRIVSSDKELAIQVYGSCDDQLSLDACQSMVENLEFITHRTTARDVCGIPASHVHHVLSTTAHVVVFAAITEDTTRLRTWKAPCALVYVAKGQSTSAPTTRVVDGFTCVDVSALTVDEAIDKLVQYFHRF